MAIKSKSVASIRIYRFVVSIIKRDYVLYSLEDMREYLIFTHSIIN